MWFSIKKCAKAGLMEATLMLLEYDGIEGISICIPGRKLNMTRFLKMMGLHPFPSYDLDHSILS